MEISVPQYLNIRRYRLQLHQNQWGEVALEGESSRCRLSERGDVVERGYLGGKMKILCN
jgi:hypothetical protein